MGFLRYWRFVAFVLAAALASPTSFAQDAGDAAVDAPVVQAPPPKNPAADRLRATARKIRQLMDEKLDVAVEPVSLFEIKLDDVEAVRVEIERLRAILARADAEDKPDAGAARPAAPVKRKPAKAPDAGAPDASVVDVGELDPALWKAQLELDRARLAFFTLAKGKRKALLAKHAERQRADEEAKSKQELSAADQKIQNAEEEERKAREALAKARTEGEKLVRQERLRLTQVGKKQAELDRSLLEKERELDANQENALGLSRRVREAVARGASGDRNANDRLYEELRGVLKQARASLADSTATLARADFDVPDAGEDPLLDLPAEVDRAPADEVRRKVEDTARTLRERKEKLATERARRLAQRVEVLNNDRLSLLPHLSDPKRTQVTGFGPSGVDQAASEVRQVAVVLGYHLTAAVRWIGSVQRGEARGRSAMWVTLVIFKWLIALAVFVWWRRRAPRFLQNLYDDIEAADAKQRPRAPRDSPALRGMKLLRRIRSPLEWLLLLLAANWLLPSEARGLLEVKLITTVFTWTLGGSLAVLIVDFLAGEEGDRRLRRSKLQTAHLRLRSLKLVGRVVVAFGLVLALTAQLVGQGTIYGWVLRLCWFAAIPVLLLIVKWWRSVIFQLVELKRKKTALDSFVVKHQSGWASFAASLLGGAALLFEGVYRYLRAWIGGFDATRRVLAYLFRREISKKADAHAKIQFKPLPARVFRDLGPTAKSEKLVPSVADTQVDEVIRRINAEGGGVFAIVGERGAGKSTLLERIEAGAPGVKMMNCPFGGMDVFAPAFLRAIEAEEIANLEEAAASYDKSDEADAGILVDNAHRLIKPMMGGLRNFDRVLAIARKHSKNVAWVFAFDEVIWRFFERMRGATPLFDEVIRLEPWEEQAIARLLKERARALELEPHFDHLVAELPADADDVDRQDALIATEASYYRLLWDYSGGNPGIALHVFRESLGVESDDRVSVKFFQAPGTQELEKLPDSAVFVLRALIQLEHATPEEISRASGIAPSEVEDALRFGTLRGYFTCNVDSYHVTWKWFRPITLFLRRRHLLFSGV